MKNLITSIFLILLSFSLFSQINYSVGMGPQYNFGAINTELQIENEANFTFFGKGEIYYSCKKMRYNLSAQWNRTEWNQKEPNSSIRDDFRFSTDYLNITPSIGLKPVKYLEINAGGYLGFNIQEAIFNESSNTWQRISGFNLIDFYDFGVSFGLNTYFAQNFSVELKYNIGSVSYTHLTLPTICSV